MTLETRHRLRGTLGLKITEPEVSNHAIKRMTRTQLAAALTKALGPRWPAVMPNKDCKPLAEGIGQAFLDRCPTDKHRRMMQAFLRRLTRSTTYLSALAAEGAQRHDIDGKPVGAVSGAHQAHAKDEIERRRSAKMMTRNL